MSAGRDGSVRSITVQVVALGAFCDVASPPGADSASLDFRIEEFATLSDGRRVVVTDDRGWSMRSSGDGSPWTDVSEADLVGSALTAVLPDDAEDTGEEHPWELFADRLQASGVETTAAALEDLPYEVALSDGIRSRLASQSQDGRQSP